MFLIAPFGEDYVAAQQVGISLSGILYMIPQSVGSAGTVRIGFSLGRREFSRARYISGVSLAFGLDARRDYRAFFGIIPFAAGKYVQR